MDFKIKWNEFLDRLAAEGVKKISLGIGVFDGVHQGHAKLLHTLAEHAAETASCPVALTFSPHPRTLVSPDHPPKLLMSLARRIETLKKHGIKEVFVIHFDEKFSRLEPEEFLQMICGNPMVKTDRIIVGRNWKFGCKGRGDAELLGRFCSENGILFTPIEEFKIAGEKISSANIRLAIANGFLDQAELMLGRDFELVGEVVKGFSFAGGKLGHPTANLVADSEILPPDGVYAATALFDGIRYPAAVNIGVAPSFEFNRRMHRIEVHLLDFNDNLYGSSLKVRLLKYLRSERFFASAEDLKAQITKDIQQIRDLI